MDERLSLATCIANIMEWSKWTYDQILDTPFIPMLSIIQQVASIHTDDEDPTGTHSGSLYDPGMRQQMLENPDQFRPDYGTVKQT